MVGILEIEAEALKLDVRDRAQLAASLLATLPDCDYDVSDEEVFRRDAELESGAVEGISHEEFMRHFEEKRQNLQ
ncbi:MAG: hypothetical protein U0984_17770 [Prosthecobacter sp.]|nr:hypothetical protein [Prosthecobacter sp.]